MDDAGRVTLQRGYVVVTEQSTDSKSTPEPAMRHFPFLDIEDRHVSTFPCGGLKIMENDRSERHSSHCYYVHKGCKQTISQLVFQNIFYIVCTSLANNRTCSIQLLCTEVYGVESTDLKQLQVFIDKAGSVD